MRVLMFVVTVINYIPFQELTTLSNLMQTKNPKQSIIILINQTVKKLIEFDQRYQKILQEAGLLHMLITLLKQTHKQLTIITNTTERTDNPPIFIDFIDKQTENNENNETEKKEENQNTGEETGEEEKGEEEGKEEEKGVNFHTMTIWMEMINCLLKDNCDNILIFKLNGGIQLVFNLLYHRNTRNISLSILQDITMEPGFHQEIIASFIEILQISCSNYYFEMKKDILQTLQRCFLNNNSTRDSFRNSGGFTCLISLLTSLDNVSLSNIHQHTNSLNLHMSQSNGNILEYMNNTQENKEITMLDIMNVKLTLVKVIFQTITTSIYSHYKNRLYFKEKIVFTLGKSVLLLFNPLQCKDNKRFIEQKEAEKEAIHRESFSIGKEDRIEEIIKKIAMRREENQLLSTIYYNVLDSLLSISTEYLYDSNSIEWEPDQLIIFHPEILMIIFEIILELNEYLEVQLAILKKIYRIISQLRRNIEPLCTIGLLNFIISKFKWIILDKNHMLQSILLLFIEELGSHRISVEELREFTSFLKEENAPTTQLLKSISKMTKQGNSPPFVEFDLSRYGYGCLNILSFGSERTWPPANGYTFLTWIYIEKLSNISYDVVDLFTFYSDDQKCYISTSIRAGRFILQMNNKEYEFPGAVFQLKTWYHVAFVHQKNRFQNQADAKLFMNGELVDTVKTPYISQSYSNIGGYIGKSPNSFIHSSSTATSSSTTSNLPSTTPSTASTALTSATTGLTTINTYSYSNKPNQSVTGMSAGAPGSGNNAGLPIIWRIGPCYLLEEVLNWDTILSIYCLGVRYCSNFQASSFQCYTNYQMINSRCLAIIQNNDSTLQSMLTVTSNVPGGATDTPIPLVPSIYTSAGTISLSNYQLSNNSSIKIER